jgi:hypothetical protein
LTAESALDWRWKRNAATEVAIGRGERAGRLTVPLRRTPRRATDVAIGAGERGDRLAVLLRRTLRHARSIEESNER